jgi:hypothetical protein
VFALHDREQLTHATPRRELGSLSHAVHVSYAKPKKKGGVKQKKKLATCYTAELKKKMKNERGSPQAQP